MQPHAAPSQPQAAANQHQLLHVAHQLQHLRAARLPQPQLAVLQHQLQLVARQLQHQRAANQRQHAVQPRELAAVSQSVASQFVVRLAVDPFVVSQPAALVLFVADQFALAVAAKAN